MNKRQAKKKQKHEKNCEDIWGYVMSYSNLRKSERLYHEEVVVSQNFRNITDYSDMVELSNILGLPYKVPENNYRYPNRLRFHTIRKIEGVIRELK